MGILPLSIPEFSPWRVFILLNTIPSWIACAGLMFLPESPKFLLSLGKSSASLNTLKKIYLLNNGDFVDYPCKHLVPLTVVDTKEPSSIAIKIWKQIKVLFARERIFQTINFCAVISSLTFAGFGIYMWLPITVSFFMGSENNSDGNICTIIQRSQSTNSTAVDCGDPVETFQFKVMIFCGFCFYLFYLFISQVVTLVGKKLLFGEFMLFQKQNL